MVAYLNRIDTGYAGDMTREPGPGDIVNENLDPTVDWTKQAFGIPVVYSGSGLISPVTGDTTAADIKGFLVRSFPGRAVTLGGLTAYPVAGSGASDVARRGFMAVTLRGAAAAVKGGAVYVRIANAGAGQTIGGIEAAADGTNTIELANAQFEGPAGADGVTEISFNVQ